MQLKRIRWSWVLIGVTGTIIYTLGYLGFREYFQESVPPKTIADIHYLTGNLFTMGSGILDGSIPWKLEIARFTAPLLAASAILSAVFALFSVEFRRFRVGLRGGHVIVCGLGRKGSRLVEELRNAGEQVVIIESNENNPDLPRCRALGAVVIQGRADDDWNLERAHLQSARMLIATTGDDGTNVETAVHAHRLLKNETREPLHCVVHITDPSLQQLMKRHEIFEDTADPFHLEIVNVYEVGARLMLVRSEIFKNVSERDATRICILGLGTFGEAILRRLLREWTARTLANRDLQIVIVDDRASQKEPSIRQRYDEYLDDIRLHFVDRDVRAPDFAGAKLRISKSGESFASFFICFDDDSLATLAALRIRDRFGPDQPIVVRMTEELGFASLLKQESKQNGAFSGLHPIGFLDIACMRDLFLGGDREWLARTLHEVYAESCLAAGETVETRPHAVPWHLLSKAAREENRLQADSLRDLLGKAGLQLVACPDSFITIQPLSEEAATLLTRGEHGRWKKEKEANGWRHGETRDDKAKRHPLLVDWNDLPEEEKERNRKTTEQLPRILARADFEIVDKR